MKIQTIQGWLWFNLKIFVIFFGIIGMLVLFIPDVMLRLFGQWAILMRVFGARSAAQLGSAGEMFRHILITNGLTLAIYLLVGLWLQAPLLVGSVVLLALLVFIAWFETYGY